MTIRPILTAGLLAAGIAAAPFGAANAQYCSSFPLEWPFCIAGAAVGTAATIATAPFRGPYYYYYGSPYYGPAYYYPYHRYWRRRRWHRRY